MAYRDTERLQYVLSGFHYNTIADSIEAFNKKYLISYSVWRKGRGGVGSDLYPATIWKNEVKKLFEEIKLCQQLLKQHRDQLEVCVSAMDAKQRTMFIEKSVFGFFANDMIISLLETLTLAIRDIGHFFHYYGRNNGLGNGWECYSYCLKTLPSRLQKIDALSKAALSRMKK